jgi:hypothetical protein
MNSKQFADMQSRVLLIVFGPGSGCFRQVPCDCPGSDQGPGDRWGRKHSSSIQGKGSNDTAWRTNLQVSYPKTQPTVVVRIANLESGELVCSWQG